MSCILLRFAASAPSSEGFQSLVPLLVLLLTSFTISAPLPACRRRAAKAGSTATAAAKTPAALLPPTPRPAQANALLNTLRREQPDVFYKTPTDQRAFQERYLPTIQVLARDEYEKEQGYRFDKLIRGDHRKKKIALTFDDGPHPIYTLSLLNILRQTRVPATFFVVGKQVIKFPVLVQLEVIEGHEVGNHTYDHLNLNKIPPQLIGYELDQCDRVIKQATGASVRFFRPPGGDYDGDVIREAARRGYVTTLWTDDPGDYASPGASVILKRTLDHLEPGAILLLHDGITETIAILPELIREARRRGYEFVTIRELAEGK